MSRVAEVPVSSISMSERYRKDLGDLETLKQSIAINGLIQPPAVLEIEPGKYRLLAGGRRLTACLELGIEKIPVRIFHGLDELEERTVELVENIHRKQMTWAEEVTLKKKIHELQQEKHGKTAPGTSVGWRKQDTADLFGETKVNTARDIQLAELLDIVPELSSCKTKAEARALVAKMKLDLDSVDLAKRLEERSSPDAVSRARKELCDSYKVANFFEGSLDLEPESFYLAEVDPPYGVDLNESRNRELSTINYTDVESADYVEFLDDLCSAVARLLRPDGWFILWGSTANIAKMRRALEKAGLLVGKHTYGVWVKNNGPLSNPNYCLSSAFEIFIYARKPKAKINKQGRLNTFEYKVVHNTKRVHPAERPIELVQDILLTFGAHGRSVLVPFAGSGNTLLAAANLACDKTIGFDLSNEYRSSFVKRVHEGRPGHYKSY